MHGFGTTARERCRQEVNIIANDLDVRLKLIRRQIPTTSTVVLKPAATLQRLFAEALGGAAAQMDETLNHWKART